MFHVKHPIKKSPKGLKQNIKAVQTKVSRETSVLLVFGRFHVKHLMYFLFKVAFLRLPHMHADKVQGFAFAF